MIFLLYNEKEISKKKYWLRTFTKVSGVKNRPIVRTIFSVFKKKSNKHFILIRLFTLFIRKRG